MLPTVHLDNGITLLLCSGYIYGIQEVSVHHQCPMACRSIPCLQLDQGFCILCLQLDEL